MHALYQGHETRRIQVLALRPGSVVATVMITLAEQGAPSDAISLAGGTHDAVTGALKRQLEDAASPLRQGFVTRLLKAIELRAVLPERHGARDSSVALNDACTLPHRWINLLHSSQSSSDCGETEEEDEGGDEEVAGRCQDTQHLEQDEPAHGWRLSLDEPAAETSCASPVQHVPSELSCMPHVTQEGEDERAVRRRLEQMLQEVQERASGCAAALAVAEDTATKAKQRVSELERQNVALAAQVGALQHDPGMHTLAARQTSPPENDLAQAHGEVVALKSELHEREHRMVEWEGKVEALEAAKRSLAAEASALRERVAIAESARATCERQSVEKEHQWAREMEDAVQDWERERQKERERELEREGKRQVSRYKVELLVREAVEVHKILQTICHALSSSGGAGEGGDMEASPSPHGRRPARSSQGCSLERGLDDQDPDSSATQVTDVLAARTEGKLPDGCTQLRALRPTPDLKIAQHVQECQELRQELRERDSAMLLLQAELAASRQQVPHPCPLPGQAGGGAYIATRRSTPRGAFLCL